MYLEEIRSQVLGLPEVAAWPEMADFFERATTQHCIKCEYPLLACQAVGGEMPPAVSAAAALACIQCGLVLVDDMLDEDPRGVHLQLGQSTTANLAFAFQAAAFRIIAHIPVEAERRAAVSASLAQMALTSALGQNLDAQNLSGEENYWKIVQAKSAPFFGTAFYTGAMLGQESCEVAGLLRDFGFLLGEIVQIYDDITDALESPASPDWKQGRNNLAILYALTANHSDRARFEALLPQVNDPQILQDAQQILIHCGAVSYCVYQVIKRCQAAQRLIDSTPLTDPVPLRGVLARQTKPLATLLETMGIEIPPELGIV